MLKLSRLNLSLSIAALVGAIAVGGLVGCGDNKPKTNGGGDGGLCSGSFVSPTDTSTLTIANDLNHSCAGSLHTDVSLATSQADGTSVDLYVGGTKVANATVMGAEVHFLNVQLAQGDNTLNAVFSATCSLMAKVTVDCHLPTCNITKPVLSATHTALNGVAAAMSGDRVSAVGSPYQAEFDVVTDVEDGQPVQLKITTGTASSSTTIVQGTAVSGKTTFPGVTLVPDGNYTIEADCTNKAGVLGQSTKGTYPVDSTAPVLSISSPSNGKFFGPTELTNGAFQVCAQTPDKDATALPAALGDAVKNLSVAVGTGSPDPTNGYAAVTATGTDTCVNVMCTSSTPIDLTVTLKDAAGNPTVKTISQIACATTLPGVQIVSPHSDTTINDPTPFTDQTQHLLAATSGNTLKDQDAVRLGAQWTVVACSDKAGAATLFGGSKGGTLNAIAGPLPTTAAVSTDGCPNGYANVVKFIGATLPDSQENGDETLASPTELRVDVTTPASATGSSLPVDLWVDASAPNIQPYLPNPLCGLIHQGTTDWITTVQLISTTPGVTLLVNSPTGSMSYPTAARMSVFNTFTAVTFFRGVNQVTATAADAAGNVGVLTSPCTVTVGTPPIVTFASPNSTKTLCASTSSTGTCIADADAATADWQGSLSVDVTVAGSPATTGMVTFTAGTTTIGTANIDSSSGHAELTNITIPEGKAVAITATTTDIGGNGTGIATETLIVDTVIPDAVAAITPTVKDRRQTTFHLSWIAPGDAGQPIASYLVKMSKSAITTGNFDAATNIAYTGAPVAPGATDGIDVPGLVIENNYYFAVAAVDAAGNRSAVVSAGPAIAHFNLKVLLPPGGVSSVERFGSSIDGVADLNGDGRSDILIGAANGQQAYVFYGSANFSAVTAPSVVISGPAAVNFGRNFIDIGDIDADGKDDFALSDTTDSRVYIFRGRTTWRAAYSANTDADYVIQVDPTTYTLFGSVITRLGDFNGDGVDDFAITSFNYNAGAGLGQGRVVIVLGKKNFSGVAPDFQMIDGDPAYGAGNFGVSTLGTGRLYTTTLGNTLVVAAPGAGANGRGRVYAFHGHPGGAAVFSATAADSFVDGPVDGIAYGQTMGLVGAIAGVPGVAIGAGRNSTLGAGIVDLYYGSIAGGPFSSAPLRFTDSLAMASATDAFGRVILGCTFAGTSTTVSIIGDSKPDMVTAPLTESGGGPARIYIVDGSRFSTLTSPVDVVTGADVILPLPADWKTVSLQRNGMIRDLDGDGYADFAIGENISPGSGRVAVYW